MFLLKCLAKCGVLMVFLRFLRYEMGTDYGENGGGWDIADDSDKQRG